MRHGVGRKAAGEEGSHSQEQQSDWDCSSAFGFNRVATGPNARNRATAPRRPGSKPLRVSSDRPVKLSLWRRQLCHWPTKLRPRGEQQCRRKWRDGRRIWGQRSEHQQLGVWYRERGYGRQQLGGRRAGDRGRRQQLGIWHVRSRDWRVLGCNRQQCRSGGPQAVAIRNHRPPRTAVTASETEHGDPSSLPLHLNGARQRANQRFSARATY